MENQKKAYLEDFQLFISKNLNHLIQNPAKNLNESAERMQNVWCVTSFMVIVDNQQQAAPMSSTAISCNHELYSSLREKLANHTETTG